VLRADSADGFDGARLEDHDGGSRRPAPQVAIEIVVEGVPPGPQPIAFLALGCSTPRYGASHPQEPSRAGLRLHDDPSASV
jgi:hypothetical protein